jgi:hypothetical protein
MRSLRLILLILTCLSDTFIGAQSPRKIDIKAVVRAGHLNGPKSEYENDYFGVTVRLPEPNTRLVLNGLVKNDRAILLEAMNEKGDISEWHKFAIDVQSADLPSLTSITQFVQTLRHQVEREEGFQTVRAEDAFTVAGREFVESDLKKQSEGGQYYKAIMFTRTKGYLLGFWIEVKSQEQLRKATNLEGKIKFR